MTRQLNTTQRSNRAPFTGQYNFCLKTHLRGSPPSAARYLSAHLFRLDLSLQYLGHREKEKNKTKQNVQDSTRLKLLPSRFLKCRDISHFRTRLPFYFHWGLSNGFVWACVTGVQSLVKCPPFCPFFHLHPQKRGKIYLDRVLYWEWSKYGYSFVLQTMKIQVEMLTLACK